MHSTMIDLKSFDLLSITGEDSKKFLQGQITCNTDMLNQQQSLIGTLCNIKGRVIADFRLFEYQQSCFLQLNAGMAEIVKSVLDKYIVFSKAEINITDKRFSRLGLIGNDAHKLLLEVFGSHPLDDSAVLVKGNCLLIKITGLIPRYEIWQDLEQLEENSAAIKALRSQSSIADNSAWDLEDIKAGIAHNTPEMSEQYLPEALNYDISGAVDFNKGCYTGQEIVARMYYRGSAKKRLYHLTLSRCQLAPETVTSVGHKDQQLSQTNEIIKLVKTEEGDCHLLAILPTTAVADGISFYLNAQQDSPLELLPLPYEV